MSQQQDAPEPQHSPSLSEHLGTNQWEVLLEGRGLSLVTAHAVIPYHLRPTKKKPYRADRLDLEFLDPDGGTVAFFRGVQAYVVHGAAVQGPQPAPVVGRVIMPDTGPGPN